ncbi:MAG: twin-arginine translocase subunit TatC [Akkermansiaceae bacterium]|jgi:sec-independent protein translocase protein TatC|nr:twin-arginine translocase subunit TatC [Akkermansiaceae bacterium]
MFLLKKVFQLRDKANPDMEKPFLEHLEDLRVMISRVVLTLVISMIACFTLQNHLMEVLRKPVEDVWLTHTQGTLPEEITAQSWEDAKAIIDRSRDLDPASRELFLSHFSPEEQRLSHAVRLMKAAKGLPDDARAEFLEKSAASDPELDKLIDSLVAKNADPDTGLGAGIMTMSALKPTETFMLSMKLAFFAGVIVSFPFLLFFTLQFVLPGLHTHERKILWPAMAIGFGLFLMGVLFAYFFVLPKTLVFFFEWSLQMGVSNDWRIGEYITFTTQFTLLFGLSFELPVVIMALVKLGVLTYETMARTRSYAVLAIVVAAAMITPTSDVLTLFLMAGPMYILYETCIWLAWWDNRKRRQQEEAEEKERLERLLAPAAAAGTTTAETESSSDEDFIADPLLDESGETEDRGDPVDLPETEDSPDNEEPFVDPDANRFPPKD